MIQFFICYLILIFITSLFINGWFLITRGTLIPLPNGGYRKSGEVLGFWERFWERQIENEKIYYNQKAFSAKLVELEYLDKKLSEKFNFNNLYKRDYLFFIDKENPSAEEVTKCERLCSFKFLIVYHQGHGYEYHPYSEYKAYKFPEWIRKPISGCVICMASVYGSIIYWCWVYLQKDAFLWVSNKTVGYLNFWLIFTISLACCNSFVSKKLR